MILISFHVLSKNELLEIDVASDGQHLRMPLQSCDHLSLEYHASYEIDFKETRFIRIKNDA